MLHEPTNDTAYFSRRAGVEQTLAAACKDPTVASVHLQMAKEYERKAKEAASRDF